MLCSYHWVFSTHNKAQLLQMYNRVEWAMWQDVFLMGAMFMPHNQSPTHYHLEISRGNILEDSLKKLVLVHKNGRKDPLKLPLRIMF